MKVDPLTENPTGYCTTRAAKRGFKIIHHLLYFIVQSNLFINRSALLLPYVEGSVADFLEGITSL